MHNIQLISCLLEVIPERHASVLLRVISCSGSVVFSPKGVKLLLTSRETTPEAFYVNGNKAGLSSGDEGPYLLFDNVK